MNRSEFALPLGSDGEFALRWAQYGEEFALCAA